MLAFEEVVFRQGAFTLSLNARIAVGERIGVLGASGSGKSTLLSLAAGFLWPDAGRLRWQGQDISQAPVPERPMSILFQDGNLFPHLSVFDNVAIGLRPDLRLNAEARAAVDNSLAKVGLRGFADRLPADLSGGQQSRVAIARVLLRARPFLLLDEPFAALDPGLRREMVDLLDQMCRETGIGLVMATHDLRDALRLCDRVWLLEAGAHTLDQAADAVRREVPAALVPWS